MRNTKESTAIYEHSSVAWEEELDFPNTRRIPQYSHRIFNRYPARSIGLVPRAILCDLARKSQGPVSEISILDPFMGSGTTAIDTMLAGMRPIGVEIDPFARLITEVSTRPFNKEELAQLDRHFAKILRSWRDFPADESLAPKLHNIDYWFSEENFFELLQLKNAIYTIANDSRPFLDFLRVTFADILRPTSKAERQSLKPYISRKYRKKPAQVEKTFKKSYKAHFDAIVEFSEAVSDPWFRIRWIGDDGTDFQAPDIGINAAITSPPYINALDYVRCIKIESAWIDCGDDDSFSDMRSRHVGESQRKRRRTEVEPPLEELLAPFIGRIEWRDRRRADIVRGYFSDMLSNLRCTHAILLEDGEYHIIVGDSIIRGVELPTHRLIAELGRIVGFKWTAHYYYQIKDHRTSIPRNGRGGKIRYEHVISLRKAGH